MSVKDLFSFAGNYSIAIQTLNPRQHFLNNIASCFCFLSNFTYGILSSRHITQMSTQGKFRRSTISHFHTRCFAVAFSYESAEPAIVYYKSVIVSNMAKVEFPLTRNSGGTLEIRKRENI